MVPRAGSVTQKHPHVRGEDIASRGARVDHVETPPRAWGRLLMLPWSAWNSGNTPTCVGKTWNLAFRDHSAEKHPHVRGEDQQPAPPPQVKPETPPRAWGRLSHQGLFQHGGRNTPTCVGKTRNLAVSDHRTEKHPHVRGEDCPRPHRWREHGETPPRAWGRRRTSAAGVDAGRNTPTCVGKTPSNSASRSILEKHPHVRGEDVVFSPATNRAKETPPRAWGRQAGLLLPYRPERNTPTCVGKTPPSGTSAMTAEKHPHVRGEDASITTIRMSC